ncbi:hypothetical protein Enr10x_35420 [Gimesia panareensis]|uniref:Uncharacterized protein n=1 Tax=Gimesia panareensis TaxID=2527978 RepID=A0A518A8L1_9PLAN|nr:hypothetical protein Enr10x_35420 [Gimesia panareensis]QDU51069.1 hypothetical protein Pan110_34300 [Gimesia panareensis]
MQRESFPVPYYAEAWFRNNPTTLSALSDILFPRPSLTLQIIRLVWHPEYILLKGYRLRSPTQNRQGNNVCSLIPSTAPRTVFYSRL